MVRSARSTRKPRGSRRPRRAAIAGEERTADPIGTGIARRHIALAAELRRLAAHEADAKRIHEIHRAMRRWRGDVRFVRHLLGRWPGRATRRLDVRLAQTRRAAREVRDWDVHRSLVEKLAGPQDRSGREHLALLSRIARGRRKASRRLTNSLRKVLGESSRGGAAAELATATGAARWPVALESHGRTELLELVERARRAARSARRKPSTARLHRLRIRLREARDLARTLGPSPSSRPWTPPLGLRRIISRLGALHDLAIFQEKLARWGADVRLHQALEMRLAEERARVRRLMGRRPLRAVLEVAFTRRGAVAGPTRRTH